MRKFLWILTGFGGALLLVALAIWLVTLPDGSRSLTARVQGGWWVNVSYTPGETGASISLRMEGLSRHRSAAFRVTSTEEWAPTWEGKIEGKLSEFLSLADGTSTAPGPMTPALAERLARSYTVTLVLDGQERRIDFADARVTEPLVLPTLDVLRFRLGRFPEWR